MNKQRKTSHILNVFQYDADGHVVLPASLTLGIAPGSGDNNSKVPTTAWVRTYVSGLSYQGAITLTVTGTSGAATLVGNTLNIPTYTLAGLGGQAALSGTGFVKISGTTISYDTSTYATETYVGTQIANLVDSSPATLDTLNELAAALGDDPNFATTVATSIGTKQAQLNGTGFVKVTGTTVSYDNSTYLTTGTAGTTYVPYTGGTANVNLGVYDLDGGNININGAGSGGGALRLKQFGSSEANREGYNSISTLTSGVFYFTSSASVPNFKNFALNPSGLTDNTLRTYALPDASGTIALTSNIPTVAGVYLPLAGGTLTGSLGGTNASFSSYVTMGSLVVNDPGAAYYSYTNRIGGSTAINVNSLNVTTELGKFLSSGLSINSGGGATNNMYQISFGYKDATGVFASSAIAGITESSSGYNTGALVFATRSATTDTAPVERFRIASTGAATFTAAVTFNSNIGVNGGVIGNNSNNLYLSSNSSGGEISFWGNQLNTRLMTILGSGYVGFGIANPLSKVHIQDTEPVLRIVDSADSGVMFIGNTSGYSYIRPFNRDFRFLNAAGVSMLTIASNSVATFSGNVFSNDLTAGSSTYRTTIQGASSGASVRFGTLATNDFLGKIGTYGSAFNIDSSNGPISFQFTAVEKASLSSSGTFKAVQYRVAPNGVDTVYFIVDSDQTYTGQLSIQAGGGSAGYGGSLTVYGHARSGRAGFVSAGISAGSNGKFTVMTGGNGSGSDIFTVDTSGNVVANGNVAIGISSSIGPRLDARSNGSYTAAMTQPAFFGSNDASGPLGMVIQTISGSGNAIRTELTSTRYGVSGNDLTINRDSGAGAGGLTVKYQGNVGVNNPNPVHNLDVDGTSRTTSTAMIGSGVGLLQFAMDGTRFNMYGYSHVHIKTSILKGSDTMINYNIRGYMYSPNNIDTDVAFYCYNGTNTPYGVTVNHKCWGGFTVSMYYSSDNYVCICVDSLSTYGGFSLNWINSSLIQWGGRVFTIAWTRVNTASAQY